MLRPISPGGRAHVPSGRPSERGQGLVEFAIVIPVFLVLVFAVLDMGRVIWTTEDLRAAAREATRYAAVHGGWDLNGCPVGPNLSGPPASGCPAWTTDSKSPIRSEALRWFHGSGTPTIQVCYYAAGIAATAGPGATPVPSGQLVNDCTGNTDQIGASNNRGAFVKVTVTSQVNLLTGSLLGRGAFTVTGTSTMLISN
jgi:hypothetical protein